jgi:hypothetical protein
MTDFLEAIHEVITLQSYPTRTVIEGDSDFARFDALLQLAQE